MPETFGWPVLRPVQKGHKPKVKTVAYGDGYEQRTRHGLNNDLPTYQVKVQLSDRAAAAVVNNFLRERAGAESFLWTPPGEAEALFKCEQWRVIDKIRPIIITATFKQVVA